MAPRQSQRQPSLLTGREGAVLATQPRLQAEGLEEIPAWREAVIGAEEAHRLRSGPYEMTAFVMVAAATAAWPRFAVHHIFLTEPERVPGPPRVTWQPLVLLLLGIALLAGAAWREASMIVGR